MTVACFENLSRWNRSCWVAVIWAHNTKSFKIWISCHHVPPSWKHSFSTAMIPQLFVEFYQECISEHDCQLIRTDQVFPSCSLLFLITGTSVDSICGFQQWMNACTSPSHIIACLVVSHTVLGSGPSACYLAAIQTMPHSRVPLALNPSSWSSTES